MFFKKFKYILKSVRQYKKYAILTPLFMIGEAALECVMPFFMAEFVDDIKRLVTPNDFFAPMGNFGIPVFYIALILLVMAILSLLCGWLGGRTASIASVGLATNLRHDLYEKLTNFSFENIDHFSAPSLVTRMTTDINNVQMAFQMMIRIVVRAPLMLIFSTVMTFVMSKGSPMGFIFIGLIPLVALGFFLIIKFAMRIFTRLFKRYDKLNESVQENVSGIRVVKSYVREDYEKQKFTSASDAITDDFVKAEKIVALNNPLMNTAIHLSNILIIGLGALIIYKTAHWEWTDVEHGIGDFAGGPLSIGKISSLITYGIQILMSLMMISMILVMLTLSIESTKRIYEVLVEEPSIKDKDEPLYEVENGDVTFNNVNFKYKKDAEAYALSNINIDRKSVV